MILITSKAKYKNVQLIDLASGTINYKPYDFKVISMYKNDGDKDIEINEMPGSDYVIDESRSFCYTTNIDEHDSNARLYTYGGKHVIEKLGKNSKCYLYFDKKNFAIDTIIGDVNTIPVKISFSGIATSTDTGIYKAPDDYGMSYYFRGLEGSLNNWVKFADSYWRIIRVNGNGTVRMIYSGTASGNVSSANKIGTTTQIGIAKYNSKATNDNSSIGYMMGIQSGLSTSYEQAHQNNYDSSIKKAVDNWYASNIGNKDEYYKHVDINTGFCNDRQIDKTAAASYSQGEGFGQQKTILKPYGRVWQEGSYKSVQTPDFVCGNKSNDLFTAVEANIGNKKLIYPAGLITSDEVIFAGGYASNGQQNTGYYLYTNSAYWTMSPSEGYTGGYASVFSVIQTGALNSLTYVPSSYGVRPVINLRADTKFTYNSETTKGSETDPFVVV